MPRRAPFIWTAKQPIDAGAAYRTFFTEVPRRDDGRNRWFLFRRPFELSGVPELGSVAVTVDGRYQLFLNGVRIGRGPVRCSPHFQRVDTYDVTDYLHTGRNVLALLVHVYGIDTSWYEMVRGHWQPAFGDGALYVEGTIRCGGHVVPVQSDEHWRVLECTAWERDTPRVNWGLGFIEVHDARNMPANWATVRYDDSAWDAVQILHLGGGGPDALFGGMVIEPFPTLMRRQIPFLTEVPIAPRRLLGWYGVEPDPSRPVDQRLYAETLVRLPEGAVDNPEGLLVPDGSPTTIRTTPTHDVSLVLDFGRIHTGYPFIDLEAQGGEVVEVGVAESVPGEWDTPKPRRPRLTVEQGHGAHVFRYIARPGWQRFERFEWAGLRYAQVTVRNAEHGLRLHHVGSLETRYPAEERGAFTCSDPLLTHLWAVGRYTLGLCMHDGWEDCPGREQRQWLGDATVEFLVGQAAFGPSVNALNRQFLLQAAESQRPDGLTQMFAPGDHRTNALLIPDWTLQWILNAESHWLYTGDEDTIATIFPAIERALAWFERHLDAGGLVADLPYWHFIDWAAVGRHGLAATLNAVLIGALRAAARLATALESARTARRFAALAERGAAALNARHWDAGRGVYVDCVDPRSGRQEPRVSQHANAAMILWDIAPRERWEPMIARITDRARLVFTAAPPVVPSGEPFDPETHVVLANTFFSHFVYAALARAGRFDLALGLIRERYGRMLRRGATTLWESYDPTASLCHGFSATPVFQLSSQVLGVHPLEPGFRRFRVAPQLADLTHARGVVATVAGDVYVAWKQIEGTLRLVVNVPDGTVAEIVAPSGYRITDGVGILPTGTHRMVLERS